MARFLESERTKEITPYKGEVVAGRLPPPAMSLLSYHLWRKIMITFDEWRKKVSEEVEKNAEDLKEYLY